MTQTQLDRFTPNIVTKNVTPQNILDAVDARDYSRAMILALALNDFKLLNLVYTSIPYKCILIVVQSVPPILIASLLNFLRVCLLDVVRRPDSRNAAVGGSPHLQYHLKWLTSIFTSHHLASLQQVDSSLKGVEEEGQSGNESLIASYGEKYWYINMCKDDFILFPSFCRNFK